MKRDRMYVYGIDKRYVQSGWKWAQTHNHDHKSLQRMIRKFEALTCVENICLRRFRHRLRMCMPVAYEVQMLRKKVVDVPLLLMSVWREVMS